MTHWFHHTNPDNPGYADETMVLKGIVEARDALSDAIGRAAALGSDLEVRIDMAPAYASGVLVAHATPFKSSFDVTLHRKIGGTI